MDHALELEKKIVLVHETDSRHNPFDFTADKELAPPHLRHVLDDLGDADISVLDGEGEGVPDRCRRAGGRPRAARPSVRVPGRTFGRAA